MIVLDTSFLIDYVRDERLHGVLPAEEIPAATVISYYEIMAGAQRLRSKREEAFFRRLFTEVEILEFTVPAAEIASAIGARMAAAGSPVNAFDILIAGIALANHAHRIVTADADFKEIAKFAEIDTIGYDRE